MLPPLLVSELNTFLSQKQLNEAYTHCQANPGPLTQSLSNALIKANYERDMYNKPAMENALADECFRTETRLMVTVNYFNTLAVLAPMIGLLGTVSGMINSFGALTAGRAEAADLAKGIGEALVATGGGLLLAIPSMFLYFHFRGAVSTQMADMHAALSHMLDRFTGEAHGTPPSVQSHNAAAFTQ
jgi:biopolymer transport protein ExbB